MEKGEYIIFKGNSRPRIIAKVIQDSGEFVNCSFFNWDNMCFNYGSVYTEKIVGPAVPDEILEFNRLENLFGEGADLYHAYFEMEDLARQLEKAAQVIQVLTKKLRK